MWNYGCGVVGVVGARYCFGFCLHRLGCVSNAFGFCRFVEFWWLLEFVVLRGFPALSLFLLLGCGFLVTCNVCLLCERICLCVCFV